MNIPESLKPKIPAIVLGGLGLAALLSAGSMSGCSSPHVRNDTVRPLIEIMDERVDFYVENDTTLSEPDRLAALVFGDAALQLVAELDATSDPTALAERVAPLYELEVEYTLSDESLRPRVQAALLRNGLIVLTICSRALGEPDPIPPVVPGLPEAPAIELDEGTVEAGVANPPLGG